LTKTHGQQSRPKAIGKTEATAILGVSPETQDTQETKPKPGRQATKATATCQANNATATKPNHNATTTKPQAGHKQKNTTKDVGKKQAGKSGKSGWRSGEKAPEHLP
jgi:hypothetical protein